MNAIVEGVFAINKPASITSAQVLRDLQAHFGPSTLFAPWLRAERARLARENAKARRRKNVQVKIGHGGTLDPLATGVLIAGVGRGTKSLGRFLDCTKTYEAVVVFGVATDSYDRVGKVVARAGVDGVTRSRVEQALQRFRGPIMQVPPVFSALKVQGKKLYEYAREGKEIPIAVEARPVEVLEMDLVQWWDKGEHSFKMPAEEAEKEVKIAARKLMDVAEEAEGVDEPGSSGAEQPQDAQAPSDRKRKRDENDTDTLVSDDPLAAKKQRSAIEHSMSGALQPAAPEMAEAHELAESNGEPDTSEPATQYPAAKIRMTVTSGFYVRSLCHELGKAVGSLAIMSELVRSRQGEFELGKNVLEYKDLAEGEDTWAPKVRQMLNDWTERSSPPESNVPQERGTQEVDGRERSKSPSRSG